MTMLDLFKNWSKKTIWATKPATTIDPSTPIEKCSYIVVDTELTGFDYRKNSIVSIGGIKMSGSRIELGETFYRLVSPEVALKSESVVIHGITPSELHGEPSIGRVIVEFLDFCKGCVVVGHFLSLDLKFLNKALKNLFNHPLENPVIDTYRIYEWIKTHNGDFSRHFGDITEDKDLFSIAKKYQIPISEAHNALMDAFVTAQLFQRFFSFVQRFGVNTLRDLLMIGSP